MDDKDRENLAKLLKAYEPDENTGLIRTQKNSSIIKEETMSFKKLQQTHERMMKTNSKMFRNMATKKCMLISEKFPMIFEKMLSNTLDYDVFGRFIFMLEQIENGRMNQHEASYHVGMLLKKMFVDTQIGEDGVENTTSESTATLSDGQVIEKSDLERNTKEVSWAQFKMLQP